MLLKMYRADMKNVSIPLIIIHGIVLVLAAAELIVSLFAEQNRPAEIAGTIIGILLVFSCLTAVVLTNLLMIIRFYKRMFTEEGYLTNSLPMTVDQLMLSHTLAYLTWFAIDVLVMMGAIFITGMSVSAGTMESDVLPFVPFLIFTLVLGIFACACEMSGLSHLSCSVGHLFPENKGLMTFIFYLVFSFAGQVVMTIFMVYAAVGFSGRSYIGSENFHDAAGNPVNAFATLGPFVLAVFAALMIVAAVMYFISRNIIKNHLNLS